CSSSLRDPVVILLWGYCGVLVVAYRKLKLSFALACRARIGPKLDSPWGANIGPHRRSTGLFPCGDGRCSESCFNCIGRFAAQLQDLYSQPLSCCSEGLCRKGMVLARADRLRRS